MAADHISEVGRHKPWYFARQICLKNLCLLLT